MSTTILSFQNRVVIETLHNEGRSLRYIANYLGFSKTTIFNELHRLNSEYQAELAQTDFERKVSQWGRKSSLTKNLKHLVEKKIQVQKWSPDIILSRRNRYLRNYFLRYDRAARLAVRTVTVDLYTPYHHLIHELFPHAIIIADHFHVVAQAYRALNKIRVKAMNQAGNGSHQWRALKHFWKLILTPAGLLKYDNYWSRRNFGYTQLTDVEVIQRLLAFNDDLKQAYRYYQDLILAINHRSKDEFNHLLAIKWTQLPQSLQKVQRTLRRHRKEIITSFKYGDYTNGPVEGTNNKIKVIKRTAYGFRNFFNFRARILLALPNSYFAINWKNKRTAHVQSQTRAV